MTNLDIEAVQAFVLVADLNSFTRAADVMDTTQSAVSLKIKRLETELGRRLLERTPRLVRLSADGTQFIAAARRLVAAHQDAVDAFGVAQRRLVVGISHHVVGQELPFVLKRVSSAEPGTLLEMRVATSQDIMEDFDRGVLDAAIVLRHESRRQEGELILSEGFGWMAVPDFVYQPGAPLRLATQAQSCSVRSMAITALDDAKIAWTEVFVGGGMGTIGAAVSAGLAIAALARRVAPRDTVDLGPRLGLPALPSRDVVLYANLVDAQARRALKTLGAAIRATGH